MAIQERGIVPMQETVLSQEFSLAVERGIQEALECVDRIALKENLFFHNRRHTEGVVRRTVLILKTIGGAVPDLISERDIELGKLAAAWHDVVQGSDDNESLSALAARRFMGGAAKSSGEVLFSSDDIHKVTEAIIEGTTARFDPKTKTAYQPGLTKDSAVITRALALADLGEAGMEEPTVFLRSGDELFKEQNKDVLEIISRLDKLPQKEQESLAARIRDWSSGQIDFAKGRKARLDTELDGLPVEACKAVEHLFRYFSGDVTITAAQNQADRRERLTLQELIADMRYSK